MTHIDTDSEDKRSAGKRSKAIANREWIDAAGKEVGTGSPDVQGARYTFLANGKELEYHFGQDPVRDRQFAVMGMLTKVGNIVNSVVNDDAYDGSVDPMEAVEEWFTSGVWREPSEGAGRGPKYDKDVLAAALVQELGAKAAGDVAVYRTRLDDKGYYAKVRNNPAVMARYMQEMAKRGSAPTSVDSLV